MNGLACLCVLVSLSQAVQEPVLEFPEAGVDDPAAYEGYATRFFRDSERNAFQIYLDARSGRVVHVWADATNASAAFTVRDSLLRPATVSWGGRGVEVWTDGGVRMVRHRLTTALDAVEIGWFLLGSMRQERDFQYGEWHRRPFGDGQFILPELSGLVTSIQLLPENERNRHLGLLHAGDLTDLQSRLAPRVTVTQRDTTWSVLVEQVSLDGQTHMTLELAGDARVTTAHLTEHAVSVRARSGAGIQLDVTVTTDAAVLTPLAHGEIFNTAFESFYQREQSVSDSLRRVLTPQVEIRDPRIVAFRHLDRAVRGLELLSSQEKLMAALPNYATYFGRDMMMAALMLEPVVSVDLEEHVIASVLRKLSPTGDASHEEALGGQAIRENAAAYNERIRPWEQQRATDSAVAQATLDQAGALLSNLQDVRENYRMIDDDFQLPVLVDRYLARPDVPAERKQRFLRASNGGGIRRVDALIHNLALLAQRARPYADQPAAPSLVGFGYRDERGFLPASWRDSRAGYGNGRFAMDVNVVWVPKALDALARIVQSLQTLDLGIEDSVLSRLPSGGFALQRYLRDPTRLDTAVMTWRAARRHFEVRLEPDVIRERIEAWLPSLTRQESAYWERQVREDDAAGRPLSFLAVALDSLGRPIPAPNSDPATDLFLTDYTGEILRGSVDPRVVMNMLDVFVRLYPVGLFVEGLGPVVVNDVFADSSVQRQFREDAYHSPRVVWGREVNLLLLGLARQIAAAYDSAGRLRDDSEPFRSYVAALRGILERTQRAVAASGLRHNELWSYRIEGDTLRPVRYGTSSDIQLWNLTDLAVRFLMARLPAR